MKTLIVAEKPSVGRDIARVLKCNQKGEGFLSGDNYIVSWAIGHLVTLLEPDDYDPAFKQWRMEHLPIIPDTMRCKALPKTKAQLTILKRLMNNRDIDTIVCATDSGREGELIFRYIYHLVGCKKPFKRLWISSMTDTAIRDGFAKLRDSHDYDALYTSAKCRAEADWLVGMNASRAYTIQYGTLLSIGRVQTPTLAIIVERQQAIDAFVPKDYWEVRALFNAHGEPYWGWWFHSTPENANGKQRAYETRIDDQGTAAAIAARVKEVRDAMVQTVMSEEKRQLPPQFFDLTELQRECNRRLGFSAQKTLSIAQALYEKHKLITYPRTDSRYISSDMVPKLAAVITSLDFAPYREAVAYISGLDKLPITSRIVDDGKVTDHHAILPTGKKVASTKLTKDEMAVYDRIVRKFLAAFYPAQVYRVTTVITGVADDRFVSKGHTVLEKGWTVLYEHEQTQQGDRPLSAQAETDRPLSAQAESDRPLPVLTESDRPLPLLTEKEAVLLDDAAVLAKKTQPPKAYTEATLLSAMEHAGRFVEDEALKEQLKEAGLGTPATRASIIERLLAVGYIERRRKTLVPTEKGMKLIAVVPEALRTPETTGKWERSLSRIQKGTMDEVRFMESIKRYVRYIVEAAAAGDRAEKMRIFPKEEKGVYKGTGKKTGTTGKKSKRATGSTSPAGATGKSSMRAGICACPQCGIGTIFENSKAYYCVRWKEGCDFTIWKSTLSREGKQANDATVRAICTDMPQRLS